MGEQLMRTFKILTTTLTFCVAESGVAAANTEALVDTCLNRAFENVLQAQNIPQFVSIPNLTKNIVGRQWQQLTPEELTELEATVHAVMAAQIREQGQSYAGAEIRVRNITPSDRYPDQYQIEGTINQYFFKVIAKVSSDSCLFYTLNIEDMFTLSNWLKDHPTIRKKVRELGLGN
jgi:hypothetical protein